MNMTRPDLRSGPYLHAVPFQQSDLVLNRRQSSTAATVLGRGRLRVWQRSASKYLECTDRAHLLVMLDNAAASHDSSCILLFDLLDQNELQSAFVEAKFNALTTIFRSQIRSQHQIIRYKKTILAILLPHASAEVGHAVFSSCIKSIARFLESARSPQIIGVAITQANCQPISQTVIAIAEKDLMRRKALLA